jgi:serine/threonine-protein kinase
MSTGKKAALVGIPLLLLAAGAAVVVMKSGGTDTPQQPSTQVVEVLPMEPVKPSEPTKPPPPDETKPPVPTANPMVTVRVTSKPNGAAIFNDEGGQIGTTPADLALPRDKKYRLTFRADGYQSVERPLDFSAVAGGSVSVDVTLNPTQRTPGKKPPKPDISTFE